jgi:branched-chain amino acid transport system permease protein
MRSLGYNVPLHRALAFTLGAFVAAIAGILSVWFNTQISPGSINITQTIAVLIIAVIGGLSRLEGAWIGALAYSLIDYYARQDTPTLGLWLNPGRFATIIGLVFLVIVLLSPDGLIAIGSRLLRLAGIDTGVSREPPVAESLVQEEQAEAAASTLEAEEISTTGTSGSGVTEV